MAKIRKKKSLESLAKAMEDAENRKRLNQRNLLKMRLISQEPSRRLIKVFYQLPLNNLSILESLLTPRLLVKLFVDINQAVVALRQRKIYHGDIRPALICFDCFENAFSLLDRPFGNQDSAALQAKKVEKRERLFMSPQMFDNVCKNQAKKVNPLKAEMFSLGMVILGVLFGQKVQNFYYNEKGGFDREAFEEFVTKWKRLCKDNNRRLNKKKGDTSSLKWNIDDYDRYTSRDRRKKRKDSSFEKSSDSEDSLIEQRDSLEMRGEWVRKLENASGKEVADFLRFLLFLFRRVLIFGERQRDFPTKTLNKLHGCFAGEKMEKIQRCGWRFLSGVFLVNLKGLKDFVGEEEEEALRQKMLLSQPLLDLPHPHILLISFVLRQLFKLIFLNIISLANMQLRNITLVPEEIGLTIRVQKGCVYLVSLANGRFQKESFVKDSHEFFGSLHLDCFHELLEVL